MKNKSLLILPLFMLVLLCRSPLPEAASADIREPVWAGAFYPGDKENLRAEIARWTAKVNDSKVNLPTAAQLKALIMPHAGYIYSGWTAAHASLVLDENAYEKVILVGPDHRVGFVNGAVSNGKFFKTPLGLVPVHHDAANLLAKRQLFKVVEASEHSEHSLEVIVPFLQVYLGNFELVPITLGHGGTERFSDAIAPLMDRKSLLVISSDLSHYLPYNDAVIHDKKTIEAILKKNIAEISTTENNACGKTGIMAALELAEKYNWQPVLLHYSNSGDTAGGRDKVVGYATIAFFEGENMETKDNARISEAAGQALVKLARRTILNKFGRNDPDGETKKTDAVLASKELAERRGVFVTLHKQGSLRGCIGNLTAAGSIVEGVKHNALHAAFQDYRFKPLGEDEVDDIDIEVSILTEAGPLHYETGADLLKKLRVNVDGVIIRQGPFSATFLPQVWDQLPDPADFLSHLCQKAGLSPNAWQKGDLEVLTYQVQYFDEER